jgi:hypothetical protein
VECSPNAEHDGNRCQSARERVLFPAGAGRPRVGERLEVDVGNDLARHAKRADCREDAGEDQAPCGTADLVAMEVTEIALPYDHGQSALAACEVVVDTPAAYAASHSEVQRARCA